VTQQPPVRLALVGEYYIGHAKFMDSLREACERRSDVTATFLPLTFEPEGRIESAPLMSSNWSLRGSTRAARRLRPLRDSLDVILFHTQTIALASNRVMRHTPSWISVDATPANIDDVGAAYRHSTQGARIESLKRRLIARTFQAATGVIAWNKWASDSIIGDYRVPAERVVTSSPGVSRSARSPSPKPASPVRLLFVGGDFERKGGQDLLAAFASLQGAELDIVTTSDIVVPDGVRVHRGLRPEDAGLADLYARAHVAVLPTYGDAFPHALLEALGAGLPIVSTDVGAISEIVVDGETGFLVSPGDVPGLASALSLLCRDAERRETMALASWNRARTRYDAQDSITRILDLLVDSARSATRN
jgi:glycosyltransferase involved in cell wall biosynthesis